ncbi:MAG: hypothetical protein ACLRZ7_06440 [Lachnospiraceae bacterium]
MKFLVHFKPIFSVFFAIGLFSASIASLLLTKEGKVSLESAHQTSAVVAHLVPDGKVINLSVTSKFIED